MIDEAKLKAAYNSAAKIDSLLPRRIWVDGSGRVACDGPGIIMNRELNFLDLITMIHTAKQEAINIIVNLP